MGSAGEGRNPPLSEATPLATDFIPAGEATASKHQQIKASNRVTSTEDLHFSVFEIAAFKASLLLTTGQKVWAALVEQ